MSSSENSLAQKVQESFKHLSAAAADLNAVSDELGKSVSDLDTSLKKLNLGIAVWVDIFTNDDQDGSYYSQQLGYAKVEGKWGMALRSVSGNYNWPERDSLEEFLFNDAPRQMRLSAIGQIPLLLEQLSKEADNSTKKIKAKLSEAQELAAAVRAAAAESSTGKGKSQKEPTK